MLVGSELLFATIGYVLTVGFLVFFLLWILFGLVRSWRRPHGE